MKASFVTEVLTTIIVVCTLGACASPKYVVSDVTRHHSLPSKPFGETFAIVAVDDSQDESLAFSSHSSVVEQHLTALGFRVVTNQQYQPDFVVTLTWSIEGPSPDIKSSNSGFSYGIGLGGYNSRFGYGFGVPYDNRTNTRQMFVRRVELAMYNGATYETENPKRVFEATAVSTGSNGQIDPVMPYIVRAILDDFPGSSGSTRTVRIEAPPESEPVQTSQHNSRSSK